MHPDKWENTSFIIEKGIYCYKVMAQVLKKAGTNYQWLVNKKFREKIGKTIEVYIDDMMVKSVKAEDHLKHLNQTLDII